MLKTRLQIQIQIMKKIVKYCSNERPYTNEVTNSSLLSNSEQIASTSNGYLACRLLKLRNLELPKANGRVTEWNFFKDSFDCTFHSNPNISNVNKFNYLQSLLDGSASRTIKGLKLTSANYDNVISVLQERLGKIF